MSIELSTPITPGFDALVFKAAHGIEDIYELTASARTAAASPSWSRSRHCATPMRRSSATSCGGQQCTQAGRGGQAEHDALLQTIHLHSIVSVTDRSGRIVEANDGFCLISGYSRAELLGQTRRIVNSGVQSETFWIDMWRSITAGERWRGEICNRAKDGSLTGSTASSPLSSTKQDRPRSTSPSAPMSPLAWKLRKPGCS